MNEQETLKPTIERVNDLLDRIEEATFTEEEEEKRLGMSGEPPFKRVPRQLPEEKPADQKSEGGEKEQKEFNPRKSIRDWERALGSDYKFEHINPNQLIEVKHINDFEVSNNFLDYLLGKAGEALENIAVRPLGPPKEIIVETIPKDDEKEKLPIIIMVEDWGNNFMRLVFESKVPFELIEANVNGKLFRMW